jgi:hypothetical protein
MARSSFFKSVHWDPKIRHIVVLGLQQMAKPSAASRPINTTPPSGLEVATALKRGGKLDRFTIERSQVSV